MFTYINLKLIELIRLRSFPKTPSIKSNNIKPFEECPHGN